MTLEQAILEKVRALPPEQQQAILEFAESLQVKAQQSVGTTEGIQDDSAKPGHLQSPPSFGERLMAIRQQAIENGMQFLTVEEVEQEIAEQRNRDRDLWTE